MTIDPGPADDRREAPEQIPPGLTEQQERYLQRAAERVGRATAADLLSFLTIGQVVAGSGRGSSRFYEAYPAVRTTPADVPASEVGGRDLLLEHLRRRATETRGTEIVDQTMVALTRVHAALKDRQQEGIEGLRAAAAQNLAEYRDERDNELVRFILGTAAPNDAQAREEMRTFYAQALESYTTIYRILFDALDREPIPEVGTIEQFSSIISTFFDGLLCRARLFGDVDEMLEMALIPIVAALTQPKGVEPRSDAERLYGDV